MDADVIVVGAGPAGATAALLLASAGVRTLLLDRYAFPRAKPCGDCLSAGAAAVLRRLGLLADVRALPHARLDGWRIVAPDGRSFTARFAGACSDADTQQALSVERALFDNALLNAAIAAGVTFRAPVHVRGVRRDRAGAITGVETNHGAFTARAVVGADGLRSIVAARLGVVRRAPIVRKLSLTAHVHAPGLGSTIGEMHVGDGIVTGVAAVNENGRCNVTVVADATRFGRDVAADPAAFATHALASLPRLRERMSSAAFMTVPLLASGPFDRPTRDIVFDGAALVGDAAGYFDPFTGQGIHQALCSAELLVPVLLHALDRGAVTATSLRAYAARRRALLRGSLALQQVVELALSRPRFANLAIARLARAQPFADTIIAVTGDVQRPARLLSPRALLSLIRPGYPLENAP